MGQPTRRTVVIGALGATALAGPAAAQTGDTVVAYGPDPRQRIALYGPFGDRPAPILLWAPGGGWRTHELSDVYDLPRFARANGLLLSACDYRALPGHGARHMAQDLAVAVAWTKANAAAMGGDPERLFVMGHSAGGHLAALINCDPAWLAPHGLGPQDLAGVILLDGACYDAAAQAAFLAAHSRTEDFFDVLFEGRMADFTPADRIGPDVPSAPMLILYASSRPYARAQVIAFERALDAAGRPYRVLADSRATHVSMAQDVGRRGDRMGRAVARFIETGVL